MSLISSLFQYLLKRAIRQEVQKAISSVSYDLTPPQYVLEAGELLKEATQAAKSSNYLMALQRYEEALRLYESNNDTPLLDILFRKSNYLYKAGKKEEAWNHLADLNEKHQGNSGDVLDKMRLFQQRENDWPIATVYATMAHLAYCKGNLLRDHSTGIDADQPIWPESALAGLLKKIANQELSGMIAIFLLTYRDNLRELNILNLEKELFYKVKYYFTA